MFSENGARTVAVFSHPNHELAIFGFLQRLRPRLVYLSDGGGEERLAQTRRGLESIGLLDRAHFLNFKENLFYQALLASDFAFYDEVAGSLRAIFQAVRPLRVLCDAIEFYNPVHDLSLPLVRAALGAPAGTEIFEVPLLWQRPTGADAYEVQRLPASRRGEQIELRLSQQELGAKVSARDEIYSILVDQIGPMISQLPVAHFAVEVIAPARSSLPAPAGENALRYELRAKVLLERGEIERGITYAQHYLPLAASLLNCHDRSIGSKLLD